ncbi:RNA methyltransferase, TrmH family [Clostridium sp. USBA 49]|nr:RNA methyltransferase, TrmH family [Clostridium sp. USBA 49]
MKYLEIIESKDNSLIKETKKLKEKKYRLEKKEFLIEGFRFVDEALKSNFEVSKIFISEMILDKWETYSIKNNIKSSTKVYVVNHNILKQLCSTENPQGIAAVVKNKDFKIESKKGFYILVDKVQDPGNLGNIVRSSYASGALGVILTKGTVDIYNEKVLRSTMGSIFNIPIFQDDNFTKLKELKNNGFKLIVTSLKDSKNLYDEDLTQNIIIAVGNEGFGVSKEILELADVKVKIPMPGGAESLNVAAAASIIMFEAVRQKLTIYKS